MSYYYYEVMSNFNPRQRRQRHGPPGQIRLLVNGFYERLYIAHYSIVLSCMHLSYASGNANRIRGFSNIWFMTCCSALQGLAFPSPISFNEPLTLNALGREADFARDGMWVGCLFVSASKTDDAVCRSCDAFFKGKKRWGKCYTSAKSKLLCY